MQDHRIIFTNKASFRNCSKNFLTTWETQTHNEVQSFETRIEMCIVMGYTRVYPKVSGLAACSENCKCYSSLPPGAVVSLLC
jgi:hypothetical protein